MLWVSCSACAVVGHELMQRVELDTVNVIVYSYSYIKTLNITDIHVFIYSILLYCLLMLQREQKRLFGVAGFLQTWGFSWLTSGYFKQLFGLDQPHLLGRHVTNPLLETEAGQAPNRKSD